jgi:hypothetical protein
VQKALYGQLPSKKTLTKRKSFMMSTKTFIECVDANDLIMQSDQWRYFHEKSICKMKKKSHVMEQQDFKEIMKCHDRQPENSQKQRGRHRK